MRKYDLMHAFELAEEAHEQAQRALEALAHVPDEVELGQDLRQAMVLLVGACRRLGTWLGDHQAAYDECVRGEEV